MKLPIFPAVVLVNVPVFLTGLSGNLNIAFWLVVNDGLPSKNGPVLYAGIPFFLIYTQLAEYYTVCTLAESASLIAVELPLT